MESGTPTISIVTAVFNAERTIAQTMESILAQVDVGAELVVIDGGSSDGTLRVLESYRDRIAVLVSEPDGGIYDALNKGLGRAGGDVVGFLHADDCFADAFVLRRIRNAFSIGAVDAVYGDLLYVRNSDPARALRYWRAGAFSRKRLGWGWMPPHPTFYARRNLYRQLGGFDTSYRIAADYDCMLRFLTRPEVRVEYIPEVLVRMRTGGASNQSLSNIARKSREDLRALRANRIGGLGALAWKNLSKIRQFWEREDTPETTGRR